MAKQILKGLTMLVVIVGFAFASAVVSANGQTGTRLISNVPFDFEVGGKTLPSGKYDIQAVTSAGDALMIRSEDAKSVKISLTTPVQAKRNNTQARLVFHRYGQQYFLAEVWSGGESTGRQLLESRQERAIRRESQLARSTYETIELVATLR